MGEKVNLQKYQTIVSNLSGTEKKIYECVPYADYWTITQIASELHRQGKSLAGHTIKRCLCAMSESGIIKQRNLTFSNPEGREKGIVYQLNPLPLKEALEGYKETTTPKPDHLIPKGGVPRDLPFIKKKTTDTENKLVESKVVKVPPKPAPKPPEPVELKSFSVVNPTTEKTKIAETVKMPLTQVETKPAPPVRSGDPVTTQPNIIAAVPTPATKQPDYATTASMTTKPTTATAMFTQLTDQAAALRHQAKQQADYLNKKAEELDALALMFMEHEAANELKLKQADDFKAMLRTFTSDGTTVS